MEDPCFATYGEILASILRPVEFEIWIPHKQCFQNMENIEEQTRRRPRADLDDILAIIGCSSTAAGSSIPTTLPAAHDELRIAGDEGERSRKRPKQTTNRQRQLGKYLPCVFRVIAQLMRQLDALARELGLDDELAQGDVQAAGQLLSNTGTVLPEKSCSHC